MAYHQFRAEEREVISQMAAAGKSPPAIAEFLDRDPTSIRRELHRNGFKGCIVKWTPEAGRASAA